ncbi:MAG: prepilin peptidase [Phycisphaerales bacterium]
MHYETVLVLAKLVPLLFLAAFGACIGSLINVLAYRLPKGMDVVSPPSRCPACDTKLTWRENIPIFGWLILRGRCRFCRSPISAEYPLVEAFVAVLFMLIAALWYAVPPDAGLAGIPFGRVRPEWAANGPAETWPATLVLLCLLSCLTAMTLIDFKTYTIPLVLPWVASLVAVVAHPLHAAWVQFGTHAGKLARTAPGWNWTIPTPDWWWLGASIGATVGIGLSLLLLRLGLIRRSFGDYEAWEKEQLAAAKAAGKDPDADPTALWIAYPHARREMVRELAFLALPGLLLWAGGTLAARLVAGNLTANPDPFQPPIEPAMPLWLAALGGVLMGYIVGGGVAWVIRVGASLAFRKEAMGMGDVHLIAAVGACLGWIDAVLAFFAAAFVGLAWAIIASIGGGRVRRTLSYGPSLAIATLLVVLAKPLIEMGLNQLVHVPPGGKPINLP